MWRSRAGANEYFSGFRQVGHNTPFDLFFLWIVPKSVLSSTAAKIDAANHHRSTPWLIFSACMAWDMGHNIIDGLVAASPRPKEE